jgi:hypothetical protein
MRCVVDKLGGAVGTYYGDPRDVFSNDPSECNMSSRWFCNKAIRVVRSAHRGGIIKWFSSWECDKFGKTMVRFRKRG